MYQPASVCEHPIQPWLKQQHVSWTWTRSEIFDPLAKFTHYNYLQNAAPIPKIARYCRCRMQWSTAFMLSCKGSCELATESWLCSPKVEQWLRCVSVCSSLEGGDWWLAQSLIIIMMTVERWCLYRTCVPTQAWGGSPAHHDHTHTHTQSHTQARVSTTLILPVSPQGTAKRFSSSAWTWLSDTVLWSCLTKT